MDIKEGKLLISTRLEGKRVRGSDNDHSGHFSRKMTVVVVEIKDVNRSGM